MGKAVERTMGPHGGGQDRNSYVRIYYDNKYPLHTYLLLLNSV